MTAPADNNGAIQVMSIQHFVSDRRFHGMAKHFYVNVIPKKTGDADKHHFLVKTELKKSRDGRRLEAVEMLHYNDENGEADRVVHRSFAIDSAPDGTGARCEPVPSIDFDQLANGKWFWVPSPDHLDIEDNAYMAWKKKAMRVSDPTDPLVLPPDVTSSEKFVTWVNTPGNLP